MQLVIEISKEYYERIKYNVDACRNDHKPFVIIANGVPLPKGHGDLKDTKAILDKFNDTYNSKVGLIPDNLAEVFVQCEKLIKTATTLVKADKENQNDD